MLVSGVEQIKFKALDISDMLDPRNVHPVISSEVLGLSLESYGSSMNYVLSGDVSDLVVSWGKGQPPVIPF